MNKLRNYCIFVAFWMLISLIPLGISDYDFREAVPWQNQPAEIARFLLVVAFEAQTIAIASVQCGIEKFRTLQLTLLLTLAAWLYGFFTYVYYALLMKPMTNVGYREFLIRSLAARAIRTSLHAEFLVWLSVMVIWFGAEYWIGKRTRRTPTK